MHSIYHKKAFLRHLVYPDLEVSTLQALALSYAPALVYTSGSANDILQVKLFNKFI